MFNFMPKITKSHFIALTLLVLMLSSCDDALDSCKDQEAIGIHLGLYSFDYPSGRKKEIDTIVPYVNVSDYYNPSIVNYSDISGLSLTKLTLTLSQNSDSLFFKLLLKSSIDSTGAQKKDSCTLRVKYSRVRVFINYKCGYRTHYNVLSVDTFSKSSSFIDSVRIIQPTINNVNQENCKIYIHPNNRS
jgi:hypothetical protein